MKTLHENAPRVEHKTGDIISFRPMRLKVRAPVDDIEREACPGTAFRGPRCYRSGWIAESEFICTRDKDHGDDHVAGAGSVVCVRWPQ
jgi:hypothetical protein